MENLPFDVLSEIFIQCLCGLPIVLPPNNPHNVPWVLTQICSTWRSVALTTPRLWSDFIVLPCEQEYPVKIIAETCFSRAGSYPLTIENIAQFKTDVTFDFIRELVVPYSGRLRSLCLDGTVSFYDPLLALPPHSFSSLEHLSMLVLGVWQFQIWSFKTTAFKLASRLRTVRVKTPRFEIHLDQLNLPWPQLTELHLENTYVSPVACHSVFRECKKLQRCSLVMVSYVADDVADDTPITLPLLEFKLWVGKGGDYCRFLRPLVLPVLRHFKLVANHAPRSSPLTDLKRILDRMAGSLEELDIAVRIAGGFESLLESTPLLRTLKIGHKSAMETVVVERILRGELLPRLEFLECLPVSPDTFLDAVEAWWAREHGQVSGLASVAPVHLKSIMIILKDSVREQHDRIHSLNAEGLGLHFRSTM